MSDAIVLVDRQMTVAYMNRAATERYECELQRALGRPLSEIYSFYWDTPEDEEAAQQALAETRRWQGETWHVAPSGRRYRVESTVTTLDDGGLLATIREVTDRHRADALRATAEERLRQSEENLRSLVASLPSGAAFVVDGQLRILLAGGEALHDLGVTATHLEGKTIHEVLEPAGAASYEPLYRRGFAGERFTWEHEVNGHTFVTHGVPLRTGERGDIHAVLVASYDITERKRAEGTIRRAGDSLRLLVEQSPFGVYAVDADFRLAMVSRGAQPVFENVRPLLGRDFEEVLRTIWSEPFLSEAVQLFRRTLATGESYHAPATIERRADIGRTEAYDWKIERVVLPDGRPGVVCHFYDLTERQRYEEALRESETELQKAVAARDQFLGLVSHELRTPIAIVAANIELMHRTAELDRSERLAGIQREMAENIERAIRIVDNMLALARIEAGAIPEAEPVLPARVAERVASRHRRWNPTRTITVLDSSSDTPVLSHADHIEQAIENLLSNALKYSGGRVEIEVIGSPGLITVHVRDYGPGVSETVVSGLFEPFTRGAAHAAIAGLGLGLNVCRRLVEAHDGRIWAQNRPGGGADFAFSLPVAVAPFD